MIWDEPLIGRKIYMLQHYPGLCTEADVRELVRLRRIEQLSDGRILFTAPATRKPVKRAT